MPDLTEHALSGGGSWLHDPDRLPMMSGDPILRAFEAFAADARPEKVNLSVGMYYDDTGNIPLFKAVSEAENLLAGSHRPWGYLMPHGDPAFISEAQRLLFGDLLLDIPSTRLTAFQTLGGTGAVRLAADLMRLIAPETPVAFSRPTWANHAAIFSAAGLRTQSYDYYNDSTGLVDSEALRASIARLPRGTMVVLQGCCHNPTGADLSPADWAELAALMRSRDMTALLDVAYAGFGEGLEADLRPVRLCAEAGIPMFVALSFSKNFSLYGERIGLLTGLYPTTDHAAWAEKAMKTLSRTVYSTPPSHGARLISTVLGSPDLQGLWRDELEAMRRRILDVRQNLAHALAGARHDFSRLTTQTGLFSYTGLSTAQIDTMKHDHGVYGVPDGRICIAAINNTNFERVAQALACATEYD